VDVQDGKYGAALSFRDWSLNVRKTRKEYLRWEQERPKSLRPMKKAL
jgi:hypothetical protein